jgi:hypothetical protein
MCDRNSAPEEVIQVVKTLELPAGSKIELVGSWVWLTTAGKIPAKEVREKLGEIGFHWNRKRATWQHPCGILSRHSKGDPRDNYGSEEISL